MSAAEAVITALPVLTACTVPLAETVATASSLLEKATLSAPETVSAKLLPTVSSTLVLFMVSTAGSGVGASFSPVKNAVI